MSDAAGLQWPPDAKGRRASGAPGQRIVAAALRGLDATAADAVLAERDWRHAYPRHWRALVQAQAARPVAVVASARAGLDAAWRELPFVRAGQPLALADAMRAPAANTAAARHRRRRARALERAPPRPRAARRRTREAD